MNFLFCIAVLSFATLALSASGRFSRRCAGDSGIAYQRCYQTLLLGISLLVLALLTLFYPQSLLHFLHIGEIGRAVSPVPWLGITGEEGWLEIAFVITLVTALFVWWQGRKRSVQWINIWRYLPWVILFSVTNAFSEEVIYRLGVIVPLFANADAETIMLVSAVAFGVVHYTGMPNGIAGMVMAGVLGWLLAKSVLETDGLFWAFGIHFVQDMIVISALILLEDEVSLPKVGKMT